MPAARCCRANASRCSRPMASDSMSLDEVAELLCNYDRNIAEAVRMMLPPAVGIKESAFHRYHADIMEPWDGPSALVFTDGRLVGAALDRNGLRPCRFVITDSGLVVAGSEVGLADVDTDTIIRSGRLGPGQMILLDLERSRLIEGEELDRYFDDLAPFSELIDDVLLEPSATPVSTLEKDELMRLQRGFGYTREEVKMVVAPMALESKEAVWSMGDDTPIAALARTPRPLYGFFRQRFAQVTNPPIDSLRESCVVSLRTRLGPWPHLLDKHAPVPGLALPSPFLSLGQMAALHEGTYPLREQVSARALELHFRRRRHAQAGSARLAGARRRARQRRRSHSAHDRPHRLRPCAADSDGDGHRRGASRARQGRPAHQGRTRARSRRLPRRASRRRADRLRRGFRLPVARAADRARARGRRRRGAAAEGLRRRPRQDHVEDGHLGARQLPCCATVRRPRSRRRDHRPLLPRHRVAHGRPEFCRHRSRNSHRHGPPSPTVAELPDYGWVRFRRAEALRASHLAAAAHSRSAGRGRCSARQHAGRNRAGSGRCVVGLRARRR